MIALLTLSLLTTLLIAAISGLAACSYVNILTQPGHVLAFWARFLYGLKYRYTAVYRMELPEKIGDAPFYVRYDDDPVKEERADYLLKPILTCVYCVGGQFGFWSLFGLLWAFAGFHGVNIIFSLLSSFCAVWFGGYFQSIQKDKFPV